MRFNKTLIAALVSGLFLPLGAQASEADLLKMIQELRSEVAQLKSQIKTSTEETRKATDEVKEQVQKVEDKSIGKWLTIGGDYRLRMDNLRGETRAFTDVNATFGNAQNRLQADFFGNPSTAAGSSAYFGQMGMSTAGALSALMQFSQGMAGVANYNQARAFVSNPMNAGLIQGIGGFAVTVPAYKPKNDSMFSNRFALDLHAKATHNVAVNVRLNMYKVFGAQDDSPITNAGAAPYFADRVGVFDGTLGHVPSSSTLNVDRAYATWSNIADQDMWFSVGRRPSTNGAPGNLKQNTPTPGNGGIPALLVDYAFDGMSFGYAPEIEALAGAYGKICYGRGFESGFRSRPANSVADTDMMGIAVVAVDTDPLRVWLQWNRGYKIFDAPKMSNTYFGNTMPATNLGDIEWFGMGAMGVLKNVGPGNLNYFADVAMSTTRPNNNVSAQFGFQGLMTGSFFNPEAPSNKRGNAISMGVRYDLPSKTKFGAEYNRGSKNWITFAPAADDIWTSKLGTRGDVVELYLIQELANAPVSSFLSKTFFRLGVQYYNFEYTGSNNWVGAPVKISDVNGQLMTTTPVSKAYNAYATFEVKF